MKHVVMFSGGAGSWYTAKRVAETRLQPNDDLLLLFGDTKMEDEDLYRFLDEAAENVGGQLIRVVEGRNPWEVFFDVRYLGNTRIDPCSRILKRTILREWLEDNCEVSDTVVYLGIDWTEEHRFTKAQKYWEPWQTEAPLCDPPWMSKPDILEALTKEGIRQPRLYGMGFPHNNCGGFCIKAGMAHFKLLLEKMPERYRFHEEAEEELRQHLGKDVAILRDRRGGTVKPLTLRAFRRRLEGGGDYDRHEWGGCACFTPDDTGENHEDEEGQEGQGRQEGQVDPAAS